MNLCILESVIFFESSLIDVFEYWWNRNKMKSFWHFLIDLFLGGLYEECPVMHEAG